MKTFFEERHHGWFHSKFPLEFLVCVCVCVKILEQHDGRKEKSIYFKQTLLMSSCNPKF